MAWSQSEIGHRNNRKFPLSLECAGYAREPAKLVDQVRFLARTLYDAGARRCGSCLQSSLKRVRLPPASLTSQGLVIEENMKNATQSALETTVAARVAGEDIACGDFVAVMSEIVELPSFLWDSTAASLAPDETVRLRLVPADAGQPYKVIAVCLPFVYVKTHRGSVVIIDSRRRQLVRLDYHCARGVWKKLKSSSLDAPQ